MIEVDTAQKYQAPPAHVYHSTADDRRSWGLAAEAEIGKNTSFLRPFDHRRSGLRNEPAPKIETSTFIRSKNDARPLPIWSLAYYAIPGIPMLAGVIDIARGTVTNNPRLRIRGSSELGFGVGLACVTNVPVSTETAPVAASATAEVIQELSKEFGPVDAAQRERALREWLEKKTTGLWEGHINPDPYTVSLPDGKIVGDIYISTLDSRTEMTPLQDILMIYGNGNTEKALHFDIVINDLLLDPNADPNISAKGRVVRLDGTEWGKVEFPKTGPYYVLYPAAHPEVVLEVNPTDKTDNRPTAGGALFSPAESILVTPTPEPTATMTATPEAPVIVWNSTKDGKILWTNEGMADGLFQIKDAKSAELHHDILEALWAVNNALVNPELKDTPADIIAFHNQFVKNFPTPQALIDYVENGGAPMDIYIPVNNHLAPGYESATSSAMVQKIGNVDLASFGFGFEILPYDQLSKDGHSNDFAYFRNDPYVDLVTDGNQMMVTPVKIDGKTILNWNFRNKRLIYPDKNPVGFLMLYKEQSAEEKLKGATQLLRLCLDQTAKLSPKDAKIIAGPPGLTYYIYLDYYHFNFNAQLNAQAANVSTSPLELR